MKNWSVGKLKRQRERERQREGQREVTTEAKQERPSKRAGERVHILNVLHGVQVNKAKVVRDDPLERVQVQGSLQASNGLFTCTRTHTRQTVSSCGQARASGPGSDYTHRHIALLAKEAHSNVVPQLGAVWRLHSCHAVLHERHVHV